MQIPIPEDVLTVTPDELTFHSSCGYFVGPGMSRYYGFALMDISWQ